jgi:subtilisin family serine protease
LSEGRDIIFDKLGIAIISAAPDARAAVASADEDTGILSIRPELIYYPATAENLFGIPALPGLPPTVALPQGLSLDYLRGCRDGAAFIINGLLSGGAASIAFPPVAVPGLPLPTPGVPGVSMAALSTDAFNSTRTATWGLDAIRASSSSLSGKGVRVGILDTGFDQNHPDFVGRGVQTQSFVTDAAGQVESTQDRQGHGTHVTGTACGPKTSVGGIRYGIAYEADVFVGKVLGDAGSGSDTSIISGIRWALQQGCRVINMSLAIRFVDAQRMPANVLQQTIQDYEDIAHEAMQNNMAIIAAAGNDSDRPHGIIRPVAIPAVAQSIMGVAAVDRNLQIGSFSNRGGVAGTAGAVDIAGPGLNIYSSWSQTANPPAQSSSDGLFAAIAGTSMATPHIVGCAALIAEAKPNFTAAQILNALMMMARGLELPSMDVGKGLVQAAQ